MTFLMKELDAGSTELVLSAAAIHAFTEKVWLEPTCLESERHWVLTGMELIEAEPDEYCPLLVIVGCFTKLSVSVAALRDLEPRAAVTSVSSHQAASAGARVHGLDGPFPMRLVCPARQNLGVIADHPHGPLKIRVHWRHVSP